MPRKLTQSKLQALATAIAVKHYQNRGHAILAKGKKDFITQSATAQGGALSRRAVRAVVGPLAESAVMPFEGHAIAVVSIDAPRKLARCKIIDNHITI